jgi:quinohemoprotein amine dehydrogenase
MRAPRIEGTWILSGTEAGRGPFTGRMTITRGAADGEFVTQSSYRYTNGGAVVQRNGKSIVYTGFQWRGRSTDPAQRARDTIGVREVMFIEPGWQEMSGRWFSGGYDEKGLDVTLTRIGSEPLVLGIYPRALRAGATTPVRIFGVGLLREGAALPLDLGPGVRVKSVAAREEGLAAEVEVSEDAPVGERDIVVAGASSPRAAVVYRTVDILKVTPEPGLARVGGIRFPRQPAQFEARAWSYGPDGKRDTQDDLDLGAARVAWSLEEFTATFGDDDAKWVGAIDGNGLFIPAEDGPNPKRSGSRNNVGDVWVVATLPADSPLKPKAPLRARAHLLVTVPLYVRWDQPEVMP